MEKGRNGAKEDRFRNGRASGLTSGALVRGQTKLSRQLKMTHLVLDAIHAEPVLNEETARRQRWSSRGSNKLIQVDDILLEVLLVSGNGALQGAGLLGGRAGGRGVLRRLLAILDHSIGVVGNRQILFGCSGRSLGLHLGFGLSGRCHVDVNDGIVAVIGEVVTEVRLKLLSVTQTESRREIRNNKAKVG